VWLDRSRRWILAPASWLALGYCGYWLALALDRAAVAVLLGPWAGARVLAWRVTPFSVMIATSGYRTIPSAAIFSTMPLLLLLLLIAVMAFAGRRVRPLFARVALEFAALWAALQIAERPESRSQRIVVIMPDSGERYISQAFFVP